MHLSFKIHSLSTSGYWFSFIALNSCFSLAPSLYNVPTRISPSRLSWSLCLPAFYTGRSHIAHSCTAALFFPATCCRAGILETPEHHSWVRLAQCHVWMWRESYRNSSASVPPLHTQGNVGGVFTTACLAVKTDIWDLILTALSPVKAKQTHSWEGKQEGGERDDLWGNWQLGPDLMLWGRPALKSDRP